MRYEERSSLNDVLTKSTNVEKVRMHDVLTNEALETLERKQGRAKRDEAAIDQRGRSLPEIR